MIPRMQHSAPALTRDQQKRIIEEMHRRPLVRPVGWALDSRYPNAAKWVRMSERLAIVDAAPLRVIIEAAFYIDHGTSRDDLWLHVSLSRANRLPSWDDVREVKDIFIGADELAVQVFPPASEYVNIHPYVLHLWSRIDGPRLLPDFRGTDSTGTVGI